MNGTQVSSPALDNGAGITLYVANELAGRALVERDSERENRTRRA